eukprot:2390119-Amphidinium_carterae.5
MVIPSSRWDCAAAYGAHWGSALSAASSLWLEARRTHLPGESGRLCACRYSCVACIAASAASCISGSGPVISPAISSTRLVPAPSDRWCSW